MWKAGVPREPCNFVAQAVRAGHPRSVGGLFGAATSSAMDALLFSDRRTLLSGRAQELRKWTNAASTLARDEVALHLTLPPHLQLVLQGKRFLLFRDMLRCADHVDTSITDDILAGFDLTGNLTPTGVFPSRLRPPSMSVETMVRMAQGLNKSMIKKASAVDDPLIAEEVWRQTQTEVEKGWLFPDPAGESSGTVVAPRFGLKR